MTWPFIWNLISLYQITLWEKLSTRNVDKWIRQTITNCQILFLGLRYIFECQSQSKDTKNDNFKRLVTFFWRVKTHANYQSTCQCFFNWYIMKWKTLFSQLGSFNVKYVIFVTSKKLNMYCVICYFSLHTVLGRSRTQLWSCVDKSKAYFYLPLEDRVFCRIHSLIIENRNRVCAMLTFL